MSLWSRMTSVVGEETPLGKGDNAQQRHAGKTADERCEPFVQPAGAGAENQIAQSRTTGNHHDEDPL